MKCCHACGADLGAPPGIGRADTCLHCGADLHCCLNCRFDAPGHHNDCLETQAERVLDRARGNFCDYFAFRESARRAGSADPAAAAKARLDALFRKQDR